MSGLADKAHRGEFCKESDFLDRRGVCRNPNGCVCDYVDGFRKSATTLQARVVALEAALAPFAAAADACERLVDHDGPVGEFMAYDTLCTARSALAGTSDPVKDTARKCAEIAARRYEVWAAGDGFQDGEGLPAVVDDITCCENIAAAISAAFNLEDK